MSVRAGYGSIEGARIFGKQKDGRKERAMKKPKIHPDAFVAPQAVILGDVTIEEACSIWFGAVVRGDRSPVHIGRGSNIQDNCVVHEDTGHIVEIGENVTVGHGAILHGCRVGDNSLIGMGAILLNGSVIGKNCIVGAGALVTQDTVVPDNSLVLGSPAKIRRSVTPQEVEASIANAKRYAQEGKAYGAE